MTRVSAAAAIALALSTVNPDFHPFSLLDLSISYPLRTPKVSLGLFIFLAIVAPVLVVGSVSLYLTPAFEVPTRPLTAQQVWQRKLWEMNAGLLGLGVSLATSIVIFTGVKNLTGKPRPNFLERCQPDLDSVKAHTVGGLGQKVSPLWVMVDQDICQQPDKKWLNDGFRSFPSGYATSKHFFIVLAMADRRAVAFAGLWYITLYLCAKFNVVVPSRSRDGRPVHNDEVGEPLLVNGDPGPSRAHQRDNHPAAPPAYFLPLPYIPLGIAIFISGTRYFDFTNHGFDVLAGAAVGIATAWFGFRLYQPSLSSHSGSAWRPRHRGRAFHSIGNRSSQD